MKLSTIPVLALFAISWCAHADTQEPLDIQVRYGHIHSDYVVNADGTASETHSSSTTILQKTALEDTKQSSITYSTSAQTAEVIEAYTLKTDGRRVKVPENNFQMRVNKGYGADSPVYSDRTTLTVVFPDVSVGDTVFLSYRIDQIEPLFPDHFSVRNIYYDQFAVDDLRVRIDYPESLAVHFGAFGMKQREYSDKKGRKTVEWTYSNPNPIKSKRINWSVIDLDKEVGFAFSTFKDYEQISAAYGRHAKPKAVVTNRLRELAHDIAKDASTRRGKTKLLYEWVATNITYAGNCVGIGAVVPRDIPVVLDNKMGDCKDHATLLEALLSAEGIESTQALVNAGSNYSLSEIPVVASVNHVINYVPEFDLFMDSTSNSTPFGMLPFQVQGKPVLLVDGFQSGLRTPTSRVGANHQDSRIKLRIDSDGSVSGSVEIAQSGEMAVQSRAWARYMTKEWEGDLVKNMLLQMGMSGQGSIERDDPTALSDTFRFKANFDAEKFLRLQSAGAFHVTPVLNLSGSIGQFLNYSYEVESEADVVCNSRSLTEQYEIELPEQVQVLAVPDDARVVSEFATYEATYRLEGNTLFVRRTLDDKTPGNTCSPIVMAQHKEFGDKVIDDLKSQVLYKAR